jgi:hypothetical protein
MLLVLLAGCTAGDHRETRAARPETRPSATASTRASTTAATRSTATSASRSTAARNAPAVTARRKPRSAHRLHDRAVGYSLRYPAGWRVRKQVVATEFARGAHCRSVEIVDFEPPALSGQSAAVLHAFVQVCSRRIEAGSSLGDFIRRTYPKELRAQADVITFGGHRAYRFVGPGNDTTIFLQTPAYRIQIVASAVTSADKRAKRVSEVRAVLASFRIGSR